MALMNEILCSIFTQSYRTRSSRPSSPVHTFTYFGDCALVDSGMGGSWNLQFALLLASLTFLALDGFFPWIFLPILGVTSATPLISSLQCLIKALHPSVRNSQRVFYLTFFFSDPITLLSCAPSLPYLASHRGSHPSLWLSCASGLAASSLKQGPQESCS